MVTATKNVAMLGVELTVEERNLLSRAYKHQIAKKRESWRMITACEDKEKRSVTTTDERSAAFVSHIAKYRRDLQSEICAVCRDLLALLDAYVIPHTASAEARVFFFKMYFLFFYFYFYSKYLCEYFRVRVGRETTTDIWRSLGRRRSGRSPSRTRPSTSPRRRTSPSSSCRRPIPCV
jgi:14-3-3 protein epsilon